MRHCSLLRFAFKFQEPRTKFQITNSPPWNLVLGIWFLTFFSSADQLLSHDERRLASEKFKRLPKSPRLRKSSPRSISAARRIAGTDHERQAARRHARSPNRSNR